MSDPTNERPEWLIRTEENWITRPLTKSEVLSRIQKLELKLNDEICFGHGYWFFVHEVEEMKKYLGITPPSALWKGMRDEEDVTDTETQTLGDSIRKEKVATDSRDESGENSTRMLEIPDLEKTPEDPGRERVRAMRNVRGAKKPVLPGKNDISKTPHQRAKGLPKEVTEDFSKEFDDDWQSQENRDAGALDSDEAPLAGPRRTSSRRVSVFENEESAEWLSQQTRVIEGPKLWKVLTLGLIAVLAFLVYSFMKKLG